MEIVKKAAKEEKKKSPITASAHNKLTAKEWIKKADKASLRSAVLLSISPNTSLMINYFEGLTREEVVGLLRYAADNLEAKSKPKSNLILPNKEIIKP